jgi:hypothetical protein
MTYINKKNIFTGLKHLKFGPGLFVILLCVLLSHTASATNWYNLNWLYRREVTVPNTGIPLYNYQVQIILDNTFDFATTQTGGYDIRVTANDGTTLIPFWIESWDTVNHQAVIWVKIPTIPTSGTSIFIYYGNSENPIPSPGLIESPPTGPFTRVGSDPIVPIGAPLDVSLLAENIVYDPVTAHYWMCMANYTDHAVSLCWSNTPTDPASWHWSKNVIYPSQAFSISPHLVLDNSTWYMFYSDFPNIKVATSDSVSGTYTIQSTPALVRSGSTWDSKRVDEPYVFKRASDNKWVMVYMGDAGINHGSQNETYIEQDGYAIANNITGPYAAYSGNPCITFGPAGSYDAGTIADPWVYYFNGVYYIGHSSSATNDPPWKTAQVTTTDWITFTKHGIISPDPTSGWDYPNTFRGAVTRVGDTYLLSYTGDGLGGSGYGYRMGLATQPVYFDPSSIINKGEAVFDFFDDFSGSSLDQTKWTINYPSQAYLSNGQLTLEATGFGVYNLMHSKTVYGQGYIAETRAKHPNQGTQDMIIEVGFTDDYWSTVRIMDDFSDLTHWQKQARLSGGNDNNVTNMAQNSDKDWHIFHVGRNVENVAAFQIDNNPIETIQGANVPIKNLPTYLMSYPNGNTNQLIADWTRVRKWVGNDPATSVGNEEAAAGVDCVWSGAVSTDWNVPGNWATTNVPKDYSFVTIPSAPANKPHITASASSPAVCKNITINAGSMLTIDAGKALTVYGTLTNNASSAGLVIKSDITGTGSLIQSSAAVPATIERYVSGGWTTWNSGWHFISSPVINQSISAFTTTGTGNGYDFYLWEEATNLWINYKDAIFLSKNSNNTTFNTGQGYLISYEITQTGKLFSGNMNVSNVTKSDLSLSGGANYSWHLLGNPFSSPLKWNDGNWALNHVSGTAKIWNEAGKSYSDVSANGIIPTAQGFMVSVSSSTNSITIPAASRTHSNTAWYKSGDNQQILLVASEDNDNSFQECRILVNSKATSGFDFDYDSQFLSGYAPQFYSVNGNEKLSTNTFPSISEASTIPIGFVKNDANNFKIVLKESIPGMMIYLKDLKTNTDQKLSEIPEYRFTSVEGDDSIRFVLHFSSVGIVESESAENVSIFAANGNINIQTSHAIDAKVMITNMMGQVVLSGHTHNDLLTSINANTLKNGVYIVTLYMQHNVLSKKILLYN